MAVQPDGLIIQAGGFHVGAVGAVNFVLLGFKADRTPDTSFGTLGKVNTNFAGGNDAGRAATLQPDGKIVASGESLVGGDDDFALARFENDRLQLGAAAFHVSDWRPVPRSG